MKQVLKISTLIMALLLSVSVANKAAAQPGGGDITYQNFYDELSPYGQWMDYPEYGYVWVPSAGPDFQPYSTNGHWVWSDEYEWMWVSDYNWGWAPFHYGRWFSDPSYGWMWVPGYEWAPAWVAWRDGGDYYGWAPIRPGFNLSIGFSFGNYNPPMDYWCFAPRRYISSPRIWDYCVPRRQNVTIINNTTIINNYGRRGNNVYYNGPRRADAERFTGRINPVRFREASAPGRVRDRKNEVSFYKPTIRRDDNRSFAPKQVQHYDRNNSGGITRRDNNSSNGRANDIIRNNNDSRINDRNNTNNNPARIDRNNNNNTNNERIRRLGNTPTDNGNNNTDRNNSNNPIRRFGDNRNPGTDRVQPNNNLPTRQPTVTPQSDPRPQRNGNDRVRTQQPVNNAPRNVERRGGFDRPTQNPGNSGNNVPRREMRSNAPVRQPSFSQPNNQPRQPSFSRPTNSQPRQFESRGGGGNNRPGGGGGGNGRRSR